MKRLRFKKPFDGMNNALNIIPETYRVDKKVFEMTDGNETYKVRWEGSLSEGKAIVLQASNQQFISEDVNKIKHLMGYKSADTLGIVRGNARLDEDVKFKEFNEKMKLMVESKLDEKKKSEIAEKAKKMDEEHKAGRWGAMAENKDEELEEGCEKVFEPTEKAAEKAGYSKKSAEKIAGAAKAKAEKK